MGEKYHAVIHGERPLLHNQYPMPTAESAGKKSRHGTAFNAIVDARKCLYLKPDSDVPYQPAIHIEGAMIKGATQIQWKGKKTFKDIVAQNVIISPREIPFKVPADAKYVVDVTTCVIPATRGRVPVARPRWDDWEFEFDILNSNPEDLDVNTCKNILEEAGKVGIGTFRLKYGKFKVVSFKKVE